MESKFIEFNETLININTIVYIDKVNGINERANQFGVRCLFNHTTIYEWFNTEEERDNRYNFFADLLLL